MIGEKSPNDIPRHCASCFYGTDQEGKETKECWMPEKEAHRDFGIPESGKMPFKIEGKEVGHFCRHWTDKDDHLE